MQNSHVFTFYFLYVSHAAPPPSDIAITPPTPTRALSSNVTFTCTVTSLTQPTITWSTDATNNNISDSTTTSQGNTYTSTLTLNGVTLDSIGGYTCTATNEGGSNTATATLNVEGKKHLL